jgi:hypothetical protein
MMEMPQHIKDWVEALRSGNYQQVQGTLKGKKDNGSVGYCCLGVFCEINNRDMKAYGFYEDGSPLHEGENEHYDYCREMIGDIVVDKGTKMNDEGKSFYEIADMIEEEYYVSD